MTALRLNLFGAPRLERDGQRVEIDTRKALALLAYLTLNSEEHSREALAVLFWPDQGEAHARSNLRRALWTIRHALATEGLDGDKQSVIFRRPASLVVDVLQFQTLVAFAVTVPEHQLAEHIENLQAAVALYRADFLAGFTLPDCPDFDEWQFFTAETLRRTLADVLQRLIRWYTGGQDYAAAIEYARRWLALDPLNEPAHRTLMKLYTWSGQPSAALRQYEECTRLLDEELGVPPEEETTQLCTAIRGKNLPPPPGSEIHTSLASPSASSAILAPVRHNLPSRLSPLLGRDLELAELDLIMFDRSERLITITGPGGMGKTVLALAAAERHLAAGRFRDGVFVVSLAAIDTVAAILPALMTTLALPPAGTQVSEAELKHQVLDYLRAKRMLLVFDNFEQLLEGRRVFVEILTTAPNIHILVTSRERLHLHDEQVYPIGGLECPATIADGNAPALVLFLRTARRSQPHFQPGDDDWVHLVRICHLVRGMPLALVLAASWIQSLPPSAIAGEIQASLDLLEANMHGVPERHRSMRATFDTTWKLLSEEERRIFARLSIFRGGFTREAAQQVADVTVKQLSTLAAKSLIEYQRATDRYELHELLRQYGLEKLSAAGEHEQTCHQHVLYFLQLAERIEPQLYGSTQRSLLAQLETEHDNFRAALAWDLEADQTATALRLSGALGRFWDMRGHIHEGLTWLKKALAKHGDIPKAVQAKALVTAGALEGRLGRGAHAQTWLEQGLALYQDLGDRQGLAYTLLHLGLAVDEQGDTMQAAQYYEESFALYRELKNTWGIGVSLVCLGSWSLSRGNDKQARVQYEQGLNHLRQAGDSSWIINALSGLALVAGEQNDYSHAIVLYEEVLELSRDLEDKQGIAIALNDLGHIALRQGNHVRAGCYLEESFALAQELGYPSLISLALGNQGNVAFEQNDYGRARECYAQSLAIASQTGDKWGIAILFERLASVTEAMNEGERATRLLGAAEALRETIGVSLSVRDQPRRSQLVAILRTYLGEATFTTALTEGSAMTLEQAITYALENQTG